MQGIIKSNSYQSERMNFTINAKRLKSGTIRRRTLSRTARMTINEKLLH